MYNILTFFFLFSCFQVHAHSVHPAFPTLNESTYELEKLHDFQVYFVDTDSNNPEYDDFTNNKDSLLAWVRSVIARIESFNLSSGIGSPLDDLKLRSDLEIVKSIIIKGGDTEENMSFEEGIIGNQHWKTLVLNYDYLKKMWNRDDSFVLIHEYGHGVFPAWLSDEYFGESLADLYAISVLDYKAISIYKAANYQSPIDFFTFCESSQYIRHFNSSYNYVALFSYETTQEEYGVGITPHEYTCAFNTYLFPYISKNKNGLSAISTLMDFQKNGDLRNIDFIPNRLFSALNVPIYKLQSVSHNVVYSGAMVGIDEEYYISIEHNIDKKSQVVLELKFEDIIKKLLPIGYLEGSIKHYLREADEYNTDPFVHICPNNDIFVRANFKAEGSKSINTTSWTKIDIQGLSRCLSIRAFGEPFSYEF